MSEKSFKAKVVKVQDNVVVYRKKPDNGLLPRLGKKGKLVFDENPGYNKGEWVKVSTEPCSEPEDDN